MLLVSCLLSALSVTAQPVGCHCDSIIPKTNPPFAGPSFRYNRSCDWVVSRQTARQDMGETVDITRKIIGVIDSLIKMHFDVSVKEQLRGRADSYQNRKYTQADPHGRFLCQLDYQITLLEANKDHFAHTTSILSISPIFQAYLNSLNIYHDQSRNLVNWHTLSQRPDEHRKLVRYVSIHEGSINIFNQSYNFVELCKNNLLKEFSILELAQVANDIQQCSTLMEEQIRLLKTDMDQKNQVLQDRLSRLSSKLDSIQRDPLLQIIREARQTPRRRRIIVKLN